MFVFLINDHLNLRLFRVETFNNDNTFLFFFGKVNNNNTNVKNISLPLVMMSAMRIHKTNNNTNRILLELNHIVGYMVQIHLDIYYYLWS
jgi:hypothetical protein